MYGFIEKRMKALDITAQDLAAKLNISTSTISRFLNGKNELKFETLFELIQFLFDEKEQPKVCKFYFLRLNNKRNIKCALEYFATNNGMNEVKNIAEREIEDATADLKELLYLYDLYCRMICSKENVTSIVEEKNNNNATFRTLEAQAFLSVAKLYVGALVGNYQFIYAGKDDALKKVSQLEDGYFKTSLYNRVSELMIRTSLYYNDRTSAKKYIEGIQKNLTSYYYKAAALYYSAKMDYMDSYDNSYECLKKALELCESIEAEEQIILIKDSGIPLLNLYYGKIENHCDISSSPEYIQAYYYFNLGKVEKAKELVMQYPKLNSPFYHYAKGIIFDDINSYWLSFLTFKNQGEIHHLDLPMDKLIEKGVPQEAFDHVLSTRGKAISSSSFF